MSTEPVGRIPRITLGWRLKMSLGTMSREEIASVCDVTPSTISRWMSDKGEPPKRPYLIAWAMATGVDLRWLETGDTAPTPPGGPQLVPDAQERKRRIEEGAARNRRRGRKPGTPRYVLAAA